MGVGLVVVALLIALMQGVSCKTWNVMMPQSIMGIDGTCVTVPCSFEIPASHEKNLLNCSDSGVWNRGDIAGPSVFVQRNRQTNTIPGKIVGDLTSKNCTTTFTSFPERYNDVYYFRLDCSESLRYTFNKGVNIYVKSGLFPELTSVNPVSEGAQVRLQCSILVPCPTLPPSITWFPPDSSRQEQTQIQQSVDRQMTMTSTVTFIASAHPDQNITCSVSHPLTGGGSSQPFEATHILNVLYAPKFAVATFDTSGPVSEGRTVTFKCSSDANPPASLYTWYRDDNGVLTKKGEGKMLLLQVSQRDSGLYLCEAQNQKGSQRSNPVSLEVTATTGSSSNSADVIPYIICGVVLVLYILTVVVDVYKYQSISRRLEKIEMKGEHIYTDLRTYNVSPDYDQLQPRRPKTPLPPSNVSNYENVQKPPYKLKKISSSQSGPAGMV